MSEPNTIDIDLEIIDQQQMELLIEEIGPRGPIGHTPNIQIGTVQSVPPSQDPEVTVTGTPEEPYLNFKLKQGEKGEKGDPGDPSVVMTGATATTPGGVGSVPAPAAGDQDKVLRGDGTWGAAPASGGTLRTIPFSIGVNSWTLVNGLYTATYSSAYVTATSVEFVEYTDSFRNAIRGDLSWAKATGYGGITFTTTVQPVGTLQGEIRVIDNEDGSVAIITEQTALPTIRDVPFTVAVADWSLNNDGLYEAVFQSPFISATSHDFVEFDESIENATDGIKVSKAESAGSVVGLKFVSRRVPAGAVSGTVTPLDNADGKVAVVLQDTVMPIANGGTGANTLQGAQDALGITGLKNLSQYTPITVTLSNVTSGFIDPKIQNAYRYGNIAYIRFTSRFNANTGSTNTFRINGLNARDPQTYGKYLCGSSVYGTACLTLYVQTKASNDAVEIFVRPLVSNLNSSTDYLNMTLQILLEE